ncbi:MAG: zinc ribbon domain-containing protein [Planctomycetes bacterium]|nr:zinc ribbon domain-containing protein [Planctomycetota bacterium]MCH8966327.1 zinc ribbon domain-containing protein [Planctomycetota bacterium]
MPVYEYTCSSCEHEFEEFVRSITSDDPPSCPSCRSTRVNRKLSVFAAHQGWSKPCGASFAGPCGDCGDPRGSCSM